MFRSLIALLLIVTIGPMIHGQDAEHRPCTARLIATFLDARSVTEDLAKQIYAARSLDAFLTITPAFIEEMDLLPHRATYCHEGFETMWRLDAYLSDVYAARIFNLQGIDDTENPFAVAVVADLERVELQIQALEALLSSGERADVESNLMGTGSECYYADMILPLARSLEHAALMESLNAIETPQDLPRVGRELIAWREATWAELPGCYVAFHHLMELGRLAHFTLMRRALEFAGVVDAENPFVEPLDQMLNPEYGSFGGRFLEERLRVGVRPMPTVFGLPSCSPADLESFAHMPAEFDDLIAAAQTVATDAERLAYIQRQVHWRYRLWLQMPMCADVIELTWLMRQFSSDYATVFALELLAAGDINTPYPAQVNPQGENAQRLRVVRERFEAQLAGQSRLPRQTGSAIFTCGRLRDDLKEPIYAGLHDLTTQAKAIATIDEALNYARRQLRWRAGYLAKLPHCPEAIEFGWWSSLQTTSAALARALELAGIDAADNPYAAEDEFALQRWIVVSRALLGDTLPKESGDVPLSRLQHCSRADALAIAIAAGKYEELLKYPRADTIDDMVAYAVNALEWRDIGFSAYPLCAEAHRIRLEFTQNVGDVVARRLLDIDGRLYGDNPWRQLPDDFDRIETLNDVLREVRMAFGPPPEERIVAACAAEEVEVVVQLADVIVSLAQAAETHDLQADLPAYHQRILDWRADLMARLPQCQGAVPAGWLMNDISIDLAVLGSLTFVGADIAALPHTAVIDENLARLSQLAADLGIDLPAGG